MREVEEPPCAEAAEEENAFSPIREAVEDVSTPTAESIEEKNEEGEAHTAPEAIATCATGAEGREEEKPPVSLPTADLLLIALAALLLQGERQDNELLMALLFLLLYH